MLSPCTLVLPLQGYVLEEAQGGDLEASPGKPVRRLLSSLGLERQPQPSHKGTHQPLPGEPSWPGEEAWWPGQAALAYPHCN